MSFIDDVKRALNLGPKEDYKTPDERIAELRQQAEDAEKLAAMTKEAFELRKRISAANFERQKLLNQVGAAKKGLSRGQLIGLGIGAVVLIMIVFKAC